MDVVASEIESRQRNKLKPGKVASVGGRCLRLRHACFIAHLGTNHDRSTTRFGSTVVSDESSFKHLIEFDLNVKRTFKDVHPNMPTKNKHVISRECRANKEIKRGLGKSLQH